MLLDKQDSNHSAVESLYSTPLKNVSVEINYAFASCDINKNTYLLPYLAKPSTE